MDKEREKTSVYCKWQEIRELHLVLPLRIIEALPKTFLHLSSRPSFFAFDFSHSFFLIFFLYDFFVTILSFSFSFFLTSSHSINKNAVMLIPLLISYFLCIQLEQHFPFCSSLLLGSCKACFVCFPSSMSFSASNFSYFLSFYVQSCSLACSFSFSCLPTCFSFSSRKLLF